MYKVFSFSLLLITFKFVVNFVLTKLFAVFLGPSGIALIGNFRSMLQLIVSSSSLGMQQGIIRFTSEFKEQHTAFQRLLGTSHIIYGLCSVLIGLTLFFFSNQLAVVVLQDTAYSWLFRILAFVVPLQGFHALYFSILQGLGNYKRVIWVEFLMSFLNLMVVGYATFTFDLIGALLAVACLPALYFVVSVLVLKANTPPIKIIWSNWFAKNLFQYSLMTLFSGIAFPLLFIMIRNRISAVLGLEHVGYWEAMNQFSQFYFLLLNSIILMYVLPRITAKTSDSFYRNQVVDYLKKLMPLFFFFLMGLYLFRKQAILLLLSSDFNMVESLFGWQLLGDFFRALTLIFSVYFHARRMATAYIVIDMLLFISLLLFSYSWVDSLGLVGVVKAHFVSYFGYFLITIFWLRKPLFYKNINGR